MNLLTKAELVAEFVITFLFKKNPSSIQPVQVARELVKAMLKNKQVSISHVYVPNIYRVRLNPVDFAILDSFGETFRIELAKHLYDEGLKQGYTFLTLPLVETCLDENVGLGTAGIQIEYNHDVVANWEVRNEKEESLSNDLEQTSILVDSVRLTGTIEEVRSRKKRPYLEIIKGKEEGKIFYFEQEDLVVGRNEDCDIEINDLEISREHMRIFQDNNRWFLQDLGSTNGTFVNKIRVDRYMIHPGDKIRIGQTDFRFHIEK